MAKHEVGDNKIGSYANELVANSIDEVVFADVLKAVGVRSNGVAAIYYTLDGSAPTIGGTHTIEIPAGAVAVSVEVVPSFIPRKQTVVKLISAGTPEYSVARANI